MKKLTIWLCVGVMMLGLSACGTGSGAQGKNSAAEDNGGNISTGGSEPVGKNGTASETAGENREDGKEVAGTEGDSNKMLALKSVITDTIGSINYYPDTAVEAEQLGEIFGITSEMYDEYLAEVTQDGTNVDTLLIIKAKDDKVEAVQEAMFTYRDAKEKATLEDSRNIGKVRASRIETNGNYVSFVQLGGDVTTAAASGEDAVIEQCLHVNELVLEIIAQNVY